MKVPSVRSIRAFTLIELLVVISIIGILMTLLFPTLGNAIYQAKKTQAKNDSMQIVNAIGAYQAEYGKVPEAQEGQVNDQSLMNILAGTASSTQDNPRQIVFLEVPKAKGRKNGAESAGSGYSSGYYDPWQALYEIRVDNDYDNVITSGPDGSEIRKTAIIWSKGDPQRKKEFTDQTKWIKSWE